MHESAPGITGNILHIIDSGGHYGAEVMLLNLAKEQQLTGLNPVIGSIGEVGVPDKPLEVAARNNGIPVKTFRMRPGFNVQGVREVLAYCHSHGFQLIHSHGYKGNILFGFLPKRMRKLPMIATLHGWTSTTGFTKMQLYEWLDGKSLAFLDAVVVVNKNMLHHARLRRLATDKLFSIDNGIPEKQENSGLMDQDIIDFCKDGFIVGSVGRYSKEKGFSVLLQAVHLLRQQDIPVKLLLIGEGRLRGELTRQAHALGLEDNVFFTGYRTCAASYMRFMSVYVISSFTEGLPITLLEAMKAKTPVVSTTVGGIPDVLEHEKDALLVPVQNAEALAAGIEQVWEEPQLANARAVAAYEKFIHKYSSKKMAAAYSTVYRQLCNMDGNVRGNL